MHARRHLPQTVTARTLHVAPRGRCRVSSSVTHHDGTYRTRRVEPRARRGRPPLRGSHEPFGLSTPTEAAGDSSQSSERAVLESCSRSAARLVPRSGKLARTCLRVALAGCTDSAATGLTLTAMGHLSHGEPLLPEERQDPPRSDQVRGAYCDMRLR